jgi:hypothetical protein
VSVITSNEDFTQSVNAKNVYSYGARNDDTVDQLASENYKVTVSLQ